MDEQYTFQQIAALSAKDVEAFLNSEGVPKALAEIYTQNHSKEVITTATKSIETANELKPKLIALNELHTQVLELQSKEKELISVYETVNSRMLESIKPFSLQRAQELASEQIAQTEAEASAIAQELLAKEGDPITLAEKYVQARKRVRLSQLNEL